MEIGSSMGFEEVSDGFLGSSRLIRGSVGSGLRSLGVLAREVRGKRSGKVMSSLWFSILLFAWGAASA